MENECGIGWQVAGGGKHPAAAADPHSSAVSSAVAVADADCASGADG